MNLKYNPYRHLKLNMHGAFGYTTFNWLLVLYKNKFRIDIAAIPKVLWITCGILSTNIFRIIEDLRFHQEIKKVTIKEPVFILGYPRSGTTYLHYLLSKDEQFSFCATYQVLMPNIFLLLGKSLEKMLGRVLPKIRLMDNLKMGTNLPKEEEFALSAISDASMINGFYFPKNIMNYFNNYVLFKSDKKNELEWKSKLLYFLKKVNYRQQEKRLLIKSPFNTGRVKQILELFPDAKFINIHRNPYEVYYSNEKLHESIIPAFAFHKVTNKEMESFILDSYLLAYQKYFEDEQFISRKNITSISYESLIKKPMETIEGIYTKLELNGFDEAQEKIKTEIKTYADYATNKHTIKSDTNAIIYKKWEVIFKRFGYSA